MKTAVIANPKARMLREDPKIVDGLFQAARHGGTFAVPESVEAWRRELDDLREDGVERLVVIGGDGTAGRTLTMMMERWSPQELPELCLLPGGTMNTIARSLGTRGEPVALLKALASGQGLARTRRWPVQVERRRWGFLFGVGIIPRYIEAYDASAGGPRAAAEVLLDKVVGAFRGGAEAKAFFARTAAEVRLDGSRLPMKDWLLVAAGAIDDMGLRFRPLEGVLHTPGELALFASASTPTRFALDLPWFRLGRPVHHSLAFHGSGRTLELSSPRPLVYNLDGELFTAKERTLEVRTGPPVTFVLPPGAQPPRNELGP